MMIHVILISIITTQIIKNIIKKNNKNNMEGDQRFFL